MSLCLLVSPNFFEGMALVAFLYTAYGFYRLKPLVQASG